MGEETNEELWIRYSSVWRNVLTRVLEWPTERADIYIGELKQLMEEWNKNQLDVSFFFDPPSRDLFRALLGNGLHERIMRCKSDEANPYLMYQCLVRAITGNQLESEMEKEEFDWSQARERYQTECRRIEKWLTSIESRI